MTTSDRAPFALPLDYVVTTLERLIRDRGVDVVTEFIGNALKAEAMKADPHMQQRIRTIAANLDHCAQAMRDTV